MQVAVAYFLLLLNFASLSLSSEHTRTKAVVKAKGCSSLPKIRHAKSVRISRHEFVINCDKGFEIVNSAKAAIFCAGGNNIPSATLLPKCLRIDTAKATIQSDDANVRLVEPQPGWRSYNDDDADDDADHDSEEIVLLEHGEDDDTIKKTGVYETAKAEEGRNDPSREYDTEYPEYEDDRGSAAKDDEGGEEEGETLSESEGKGKDYGQYYDYDYEGGEAKRKNKDQPKKEATTEKPTVEDEPTNTNDIASRKTAPEYEEEEEEEGEREEHASTGEDEEEHEQENIDDHEGEVNSISSANVAETVPTERDGDEDEYDDTSEKVIIEDEETPEETVVESNNKKKIIRQETNDDDSDYDTDEDEVEEKTDSGSADDEEQLLYRNYEILSDFYKKHFVDLRVLDTSCVPEEIPPPQISHGFVQQYLTAENVLLPGKHYHEVIYACEQGYKLSEASLGHMFCQQKGWMGVQPYCEVDPRAAKKEPVKTKHEVPCEEDSGCEHTCRLVDGVPKCFCKEGYRLHDVTMCVDIDECEEDNGSCAHTCVNKPGTYTCECPTGYNSDGKSCVDLNECVANNGHGPCQDTCVNTEGSYKCTCENLPGTTLDDDGQNCNSLDLCQDQNGGCSHECYTTYGQSFCMCPAGYKLKEDWKTCVDVDECESMSSVREACSEGTCQNTPGSYTCVPLSSSSKTDLSVESRDNCDEGYEFDPEENVCTDVDECLQSESRCGEKGSCFNLEPGFECRCSKGYAFDGVSCRDVDECLEDGERCGDSGSCVNTEGGFRCDCQDGFVFVGGVCEDVDECRSSCSNGNCTNTHGSFTCKCQPGYELTGGQCADVNECLEKPCGNKIRCVNTPGSFSCLCGGNRVYSEGKCMRENPCKANPEICGPGSVCRMTKLGHACKCQEGFQLTQTESSCEDVDECLVDNGGCEHICENVPGSRRCLCESGFQIDSQNASRCVDVDECESQTHSCQQSCINTAGSFICSCGEGYRVDDGNASRCVLVSSCRLACSFECQQGKCVCPPGQELGLDQTSCVKASEGCDAIPELTGLEIVCSNESDDGVYPVGTICRGKCSDGFVLEGVARLKKKCRQDGVWIGSDNGACVNVECPSLDLAEHMRVLPESCSLAPSLVRKKCKFSCEPGFTLLGSHSARCRRDGRWKQHGGPPKCVAVEQQQQQPAVKQLAPPYIYCPPDMTKNLSAESASIYVRIPQPKTNVNWYDFVRATPAWAKSLEADLPLGKTLVTFQAISPVSDESSSCSFTIHVRDTVPPRVYNCPTDFQVYLDEGQVKRQVFWEEPIFADNVKIMHVMASKMPGQLLTEGKHDVLYQATDEDGNQAKCVFAINVFNARHLDMGKRTWVVCRVGSTGRLIKLFVAHVPRGCWKLMKNDI